MSLTHPTTHPTTHTTTTHATHEVHFAQPVTEKDLLATHEHFWLNWGKFVTTVLVGVVILLILMDRFLVAR